MYRKHNVDDGQKQELGILQTHRLQNASHEDPNDWVPQRWLESYLFLIESTVHIFKKKAMFLNYVTTCNHLHLLFSADFYERPDDYKNTLFICRVVEWKDNMQAFG